MANQYFENNDNLKSEIKIIKYFYKGEELTLFADNGVFSKNGVDFGSNLLLKNIDLTNAKSILDVGCGYGTIGLTISKANPNIKVTMVDVNKRAIDLCKLGIEKNDINNAKVFESNMYENINEMFNIIVTNPPIRAGKKIVHGIILEGYNYLYDGGSLWCVIQKKQGAPSAVKALEGIYRDVIVVENDKGYWIIRAIK